MADVRNRVYVELIATGTRDVETATAKAADAVRDVGQAAKAAGSEVATTERAVSGFASALSSGLAGGAEKAAEGFAFLEGAVGAALKPLGLIGAVIGGIEAAIALYERAQAALNDDIKTGTEEANFFVAALDEVKAAQERAAAAAAQHAADLADQVSRQKAFSDALGGAVSAAMLSPRLLGQSLEAQTKLAAGLRELEAANAALAGAAKFGGEEQEKALRAQSDALADVLRNERLLRDIRRTVAEPPKAAPRAAAKPFDWAAYIKKLEDESARIQAAADAAVNAEAQRLFEQQQAIEAVEAGAIFAQEAVDELNAGLGELEATLQAIADQQAMLDFADGITAGASAAKTALSAWSGALVQLGVSQRAISFLDGLQASADAAQAVADSIKDFASGNPIGGIGNAAAAAAYAVSAGAYFKAAGKGGGGGSTAAAAGAGAGASGASAQPRSGDFGGRTQQGPTVVNVNNFDGTFFATEDAALRGLGEAAMKGMNDRARGARRLRTDVVDSQPVATGRR